jgi:mannose-6-phosphate isomerase-like protein (cupin superfamily)
MDMLPVDPRTAERLDVGEDEITVLASGADTGGALFGVQVRMRPGGGPPVMHRHLPAEVYCVLSGEFTVYVGGGDEPVRRVTAGAGTVIPLAGGTPHTVRNESDEDAVAFVVHAPGGPMEGFSRAAAAAARGGALSMEAALGLAGSHGIEVLGPVPAAAD